MKKKIKVELKECICGKKKDGTTIICLDHFNKSGAVKESVKFLKFVLKEWRKPPKPKKKVDIKSKK